MTSYHRCCLRLKAGSQEHIDRCRWYRLRWRHHKLCSDHKPRPTPLATLQNNHHHYHHPTNVTWSAPVNDTGKCFPFSWNIVYTEPLVECKYLFRIGMYIPWVVLLFLPSAPTAWNNLLAHIRSCTSLSQFLSKLTFSSPLSLLSSIIPYSPHTLFRFNSFFSVLFLLLFSMFAFISVWCHYVWRPRA